MGDVRGLPKASVCAPHIPSANPAGWAMYRERTHAGIEGYLRRTTVVGVRVNHWIARQSVRFARNDKSVAEVLALGLGVGVLATGQTLK